MIILILSVVVVFIALVAYLIFRKSHSSGSKAGTAAQIYVGNLLYSVNENDLRQIFANYGKVVEVRVIRDPRSRRSKGFSFVTFESASQSQKALAANGSDFRGRSMVVRIAKEK